MQVDDGLAVTVRVEAGGVSGFSSGWTGKQLFGAQSFWTGLELFDWLWALRLVQNSWTGSWAEMLTGPIKVREKRWALLGRSVRRTGSFEIWKFFGLFSVTDNQRFGDQSIATGERFRQSALDSGVHSHKSAGISQNGLILKNCLKS